MQGRLLLADDEPLFLRTTAALLEAEGYEVACAEDADQAARLLQEEAFDLLISDIHMPGNEDLALVRGLGDPNRGIPVLLVTGLPTADTAIRALELNVLSYLVKPIAVPELLAKVEEALGVQRLQVAVRESSRRVEAWARDLADLAAAMERPGRAGAVTVTDMLGMMLERMGGTLLDVRRLLDLSADRDPGRHCGVQRCPKVDSYEQIIYLSIEVLERTKGAFKSKELGELRQRLEGALPGRT